jgi:hypothetical protein
MNSWIVMQCSAAVGLLATTITGCDDVRDPSNHLKGCLAATEETILLRQLTLTGEKKKSFDSCRAREAECRYSWLDAESLVLPCMYDSGYIFLDQDFYLSHNQNPYKTGNLMQGGQLREEVCGRYKYDDPDCYRLGLWFKITHWWAF